MKKLVFAVLMLFLMKSINALPVGNPAEASLFLQGVWWESHCCDPCDPFFSWCEAWSLRVGYYGDFVFNRHMQLTRREVRQHVIDDTELFTNACYLAFNISDCVDIFGTIGATDMHIKTDARSWGFPGSLESELFFKTEFSWSIGARATLWQCDRFIVGVEGQYFQLNPTIEKFLDYASGQIFALDHSARFIDWQVGLGISYHIATRCSSVAMIPYAAIKWADSRLDLNNITFTRTINGVSRRLRFPRLENHKLWGYAIGMSLLLWDAIGVTAEGRWGDEKAVYVNGQFRF